MGNYIPNAYIDGKLVLSLSPESGYAFISGVILVQGGCSVVDNCNMCYDQKCSSCLYPYGTLSCSRCISNAYSLYESCYCNSNAFYHYESNTCKFCDKICQSCRGPDVFMCNSCYQNYYLVSNVCLKACPYGFAYPCSKVSGTVIDQNFANNFKGTYGIFRTGSSQNSYYFFNFSEIDDPIPAKNRGLYFQEGAYLETISGVYLSVEFSLGLWVWVSAESGDILTNSISRIRISEAGALSILLEDPLESTLLTTTNSVLPAKKTWAYLSYVVSFSSPSITIITFLNNIAHESVSISGYIYKDLLSSTIILGKSLKSDFNGYIYQFQLWNSAVLNFNYQYLDQLCETGQIAGCLWSCEISSWISNGEVLSCDESCSNGCVRKGSCNVCYNPLCGVCREFNNGICDKCIENASGIPCSCNSGFKFSESSSNCVPCQDGDSGCNGNELTLNENIVYNEDLLSYEMKYYSIPFYQLNKDINIYINSEFSVSQVYINLNSENIKPDLSSKNYYFDKYVNGSLKINLIWDSIAYANCNSALEGHFNPNKKCAYHIGVFSNKSAEYSIKFKSKPVVPKLISVGAATVSNLNRFGHSYLYSILDVNTPWLIKTTNSLNRASLYISLFDYELAGKDAKNWSMHYNPAKSYNTSKSNDTIIYKEGSLNSACPSGKCLLIICELCYNEPCQVELILKNQTYNFIQKSTYYNETICSGCFNFYKIPFYSGHKNIKIVFTYTPSDVDLYISLNINSTTPDINAYNYKLQKTVANTKEILLTYDSIAQKNCPIHENLCAYHIGVYSQLQSSYKLIYYEYDASYWLRTGSVQINSFDSIKHSVYNAFIDSNYNASLAIDDMISGKMTINIYDYGIVKNYISNLPNNMDSKANFTTEIQSGVINFNKEFLKSWCPSKACLAQICLHCPGQSCFPKLQFIQDNEILIEEGKIYDGQVDELIYKDWKIPFLYKTISIVLKVYKGDAEMFISLNNYNERPTREFYDYKSSLNYSKAEITLTNDDIALYNCPQFEEFNNDEAPCYYHIGIYGKKYSLFTVQISSSSTMPKEIPSNTLISQKGTNSSEYRFFNVMNTENPANISMKINSGEALLYASIYDFTEISPISAAWPLPKQAKKEYKSQQGNPRNIFIENDILQESCPSELCIALLYVFCLSNACEYQLEVKQAVIVGQNGALLSGNQIIIFLVCVFIGLLGIWYRYKKQNLISKNFENLTEALIDENLVERRKIYKLSDKKILNLD